MDDNKRSEVRESFDQLRAEIRQGNQRVAGKLREWDTEIVKMFNTFAQIERATEFEGNECAFRSRLSKIEDRLLEVERRLNIPPAA